MAGFESVREEQRRKREAKRRKKQQKREERERRKRVRYTKEAPLTCAGWIQTRTEKPSALRFLQRPMAALGELIGGLPTAPVSSQGRKRVREGRVAVMVVGLAIAVWGGTAPTAVLGCVIAMLANALPMQHATQMRWKSRLGRVGAGRTRTSRTPVEIVFDGRGVSVIAAGETLRRVLTHEGQYSMKVRRVEDRLALGVLPPSGGKATQLWFLTEIAPEVPVNPDAVTRLEAKKVDTPVGVDSQTFLALHEGIRPDSVDRLETTDQPA